MSPQSSSASGNRSVIVKGAEIERNVFVPRLFPANAGLYGEIREAQKKHLGWKSPFWNSPELEKISKRGFVRESALQLSEQSGR
jgi:hypothetical protein